MNDNVDFGSLSNMFRPPESAEAKEVKLVEVDVADSNLLLSHIHNEVAAVPTHLMRTALFGIIGPRAKEFLQPVTIASRSDVVLKYTGFKLGQDDLDVWCCVLRLLAGQHTVTISGNELIKQLKRHDGSKTRAWLKDSLSRLSKAHIEAIITNKTTQLHVSTFLLSMTSIDSINSEQATFSSLYFSFSVPIQAKSLFSNISFMPWETRLNLKSELSKAIMAYAYTHKRGASHKVRVELLQQWLGGNKRLDRFKVSLIKSMADLENADVVTDVKFSTNNKISSVHWTLI